MITARTTVKHLKTIIGRISTAIDEAKMVFDAEGMRVKAVDPTHVMMLDMSVPADKWLEYVPAPDEREIGIDVKTMGNALKGARPADEVMLSITPYVPDEGESGKEGYKPAVPGKMVVSVNGATCDLSAVDTAGMSDPKLPAFNLPATARLPADPVFSALQRAASVSDHVGLLISPGNGFSIRASGDQNRADWAVGCDAEGERATSLYSLDYLHDIIASLKGCDITIRMGTEYPIMIEGDGCKFLLAPRIESE